MTAADGSFIGFARQTAKGTIQTTDAKFQYLLFTEGMMAPQNVTIPLDDEVGGGALPRGMVKVGVMSGGQLGFIPRPDSLGMFLLGATGKVTTTGAAAPYSHVFTLDPADNYAAPYYTVRYAPGGMWGEVYQDMRFSALSLNWRGANFVRGALGMIGGTPLPNQTRTLWNELAQVDGGPQFLAPVTTIELPTGSPLKVLSGSLVGGMSIPMDEQWITGSYYPDGFDITKRTFALTFNVKVTDRNLYEKMSYDPAQGGAWAAAIFREADINLEFKSDVEITAGNPYSLKVEANGSSGSDANVFWTARLNGLRPGRQVTMTVTGLFAATTVAATEPIKFTLVNNHASYTV